jgi:hypothetical protein
MSNSQRNADRAGVPTGLRWRGGRILALLWALNLLLLQCMPLSETGETVPNYPATMSFGVKETVLRKAVERALVKKNYVLDREQSTPHQVRTKWLQEGSYRTMAVADLRALKKSESELTLRVLLEKQGFFSETWKPVDEIGSDTYNRLMDDISLEADRVLYEGG